MGRANNIKIDIWEIEGQDEYGLYWLMLQPNVDISEYSSEPSMSS
jgi:hypothetical protein